MPKLSIPLEDLFREAFKAGEMYGLNVDHLPYSPDFETWFAAFKERIRKEVNAPEGCETTLGNLDIYS